MEAPDQGCISHDNLNFLLHRAAQKLGTAAQEASQAHGITPRGQLVLTALANAPERRTQLALGAALGLDKTTLTAELDRLERAGLVIREPDPTDRRVRFPAITETGRKVQTEVAHLHAAAEDTFTSGLTPDERDLLRTLLARLIAADTRPATGSCL
ncbi:MarR family winged helix-turn-helix transcriptional regulator [Saccharothrix variisporea]|uniref:DNA-binding MarR family transcriptional regulator n=1 Tax=Saccharothrix variisporea TaxID=543527 RepID=A0A495XA91_9PSEU|nr:MarR family winged helix-turn-helix transcriptional regulator [Saccharothrix variisporea]RKT70286.1 DNA-binding MarR family transcriptional regulator [Saccharothrix variisporea]